MKMFRKKLELDYLLNISSFIWSIAEYLLLQSVIANDLSKLRRYESVLLGLFSGDRNVVPTRL